MPKSPPFDPPDPQIPAALTKRFPSLKSWEGVWELSPELASLRAQTGKLRYLSLLISQSLQTYPEMVAERGHLQASENELSDLVAALDLDPNQAQQLLDDAVLITEWYLLPQRRAALRFDAKQHIAVMDTVARKARSLHLAISTDMLGLEELLETHADDSENASEDFDLRQCAAMLEKLATTARRAVAATRPGCGGRKSDNRRNHALALLIVATEQATGERIRASRADEHWRFTSRSGQFVRDVFATLGWSDERVLVDVVKRISRAKRKTKA